VSSCLTISFAIIRALPIPPRSGLASCASAGPQTAELPGFCFKNTAACIEPGPWENGYCESFNSKLPEDLDGEIFHTLEEARVIIENWHRHYNEVHPVTRI
jgi:hypothetical protein